MNWKQIAASLGLTVAEGASDAEIKALVLGALALKDDASELDVQRAISARRGKAKARRPGSVIARGKWWTIKAAAEDEAELLIYGDIGESWFSESVTAKSLVEQLQLITAKTIRVRINSYGGSVSDGIAIYNALRRHSAEIVTTVDGVAFSIASLIAMAGDTVEMAQGTLLMVHAPWGAAAGNAVDMRRYADVLDKFAEAMTSAYVEKAGQDRADEIRGLLTDGTDHYFTPDEAVAFGFVDDITSALAVAASFNLSRYPNLPAVAAAFQRNKESEMNWKAIAKALGMPENASVESIKARLVQLGLDPESCTAEQVTAKLAAAPATETAEQVAARITARNKEIRAAFKPFMKREGVSDLLTDCIEDAGISADDAHRKLLKHLGKDAEPLNGGAPTVEGGETDAGKRRQAKVLAMCGRVGAVTADERAALGQNPYRGHRLMDFARDELEAAGISVRGLANEEIADRAIRLAIRAAGGQSTSDFPVVLENTMHKLVLEGFRSVTPTWSRFCKVGDVSDFRTWNRLVPGLMGNLDDVNESGEYKNKNIPDAEKEGIKVKRRGNIVELTPETIVNDDLGYIADLARGLGQLGQRAIERKVYDLVNTASGAGPTLVKDSLALFESTVHKNIAEGADKAAPTMALIDKARIAMARQKAPGADGEYLDIVPVIAVASLEHQGTIIDIVKAQYDPDTANKLQKPNRVQGLLRDIIGSPRVGAATRWYLFADPAIAPVFEVVFLNGQREPRVTQEENFRTGGLAWRVELPFGVGAIDYRGGYFNPGA